MYHTETVAIGTERRVRIMQVVDSTIGDPKQPFLTIAEEYRNGLVVGYILAGMRHDIPVEVGAHCTITFCASATSPGGGHWKVTRKEPMH